MPNYGDKDYWDKRYLKQDKKTFDWLEDFSSLRPLIEKFVKKNNQILMLGCGNSKLSEDMYDFGYHNILNIDISTVVIDQMKERNQEQRPFMTWKVMDALDMKVKPGSIDVVIDKSTIDAILCGEMSFYNTAIMMKEIQRVLKVGGVYLAVSYGRPENRILHFNREHLSFDISCFILSETYF